jgi:hypothetical protein
MIAVCTSSFFNGSHIYLLLYVDDMLIAAKSMKEITTFVGWCPWFLPLLERVFQVKILCLRAVIYFLFFVIAYRFYHSVPPPPPPEPSPPTSEDDEYINALEDNDVKESSACRALVGFFILASPLRPATGRPRRLL